MLDGTYEAEVDTPLGKKTATIKLATHDDVVEADIEAPLVGKHHTTGKVQGDTFTAQGTMKVKLVGKCDYTAEGQVDGEDILMVVHSRGKDLEFRGKRA